MSAPTVEQTTVQRAWDAAPSVGGAKIPAPAARQSVRAGQPLRTEPDPTVRRPRDFSAWRRVDPFRWVGHRREHVGLSAPDDM